MVKADCKHDYYADLDLTSTADTDVIRKRYRDLGMHVREGRCQLRNTDYY